MTCVSFYKGDDDPEPSGRIPLEPTEAIKKLLVAVPPTEEDFKWANKQIAQLEAADRLQQVQYAWVVAQNFENDIDWYRKHKYDNDSI